jgi:CheY-like chemotaxis protein
MFAQVDQSLERGQGGLGVGLALARKLVELHGGTIQAASEGLGKGSEFTVRIPPLPPEDATTSTTENSSGHLQQARRIVVADDNVDSAAVLAELLRIAGHKVKMVHDGAAAVDAVLSDEPDLAVLDIGMPKLNGYDVAKRIRVSENKRTVLIAVTGWGQEEDKRRSAAAGFDHHLTKPVDITTLNQIIAEIR